MAIVLSEEDRRILQEMLSDYKSRKKNKEKTLRQLSTGFHQSTNVYIGKPTITIPALTTGTPAEPGSGKLQIYQVIDNAGTPELHEVEEHFITGHNLSPTVTLTTSDYVMLAKDKFGSWVLDKPFSTSSTSGDTVKLVEVLTSSGVIFTDCDTEVTRQSSDCVFRARIINQDPDVDDLCDRDDVGTDVGTADTDDQIWLHISHTPWCNPFTDSLVGRRLIARKAKDAYTIGANTFPFYEAAMEDSRVWAINPTVDWSSPPYVLTAWLIDDSGQAGFTPQPIDDPWGLWTNVISESGTNPSSQGYGIMMGDEIYPIEMRRRATHYVADVNFSAAIAPGDTTIIVDNVRVVSEPPFIEQPSISTVNNPFRLSCLDNTEVYFMRDENSLNNYVATGVARSEPVIIEIQGSPDGSGTAPQLSGTATLAVWSARVVSQNPTTPGNMRDGGGVAINQEDIWFAHVGIGVGSGGSSDPYYLSAGQRYLAYDIGKDFTPTAGSARRLFVAARDSETNWGIAYENWTDNGVNGDYVNVRPCDDIIGSNSTTNASHRVYLPKVAEKDPNVVIDDVVAYRLSMDGLWVCVSDYLDDKIGTVKMWARTSSDIPPGWAMMDGSNNATPEGSGIDMTDRFVKGSTAAGVSGGTLTHFHSVNIILNDHSLGDLAHTHNVQVTVEDHSVADLDHSHDLKEDTVRTSAAVGTDFRTIVPPCTINPPKDGSSSGPIDSNTPYGIDDCPTDEWGPLVHTVEVTEDYTGGTGPDLVHVDAGSYTTPAEHTPVHYTLIFIERVDNSQ